MDSIYIIKAGNAGSLTVCLTFNDNTQQTIDIGDYIRRHPHPQYNKYFNFRKLRLCLGIKAIGGVLFPS